MRNTISGPVEQVKICHIKSCFHLLKPCKGRVRNSVDTHFLLPLFISPVPLFATLMLLSISPMFPVLPTLHVILQWHPHFSHLLSYKLLLNAVKIQKPYWKRKGKKKKGKKFSNPIFFKSSFLFPSSISLFDAVLILYIILLSLSSSTKPNPPRTLLQTPEY